MSAMESQITNIMIVCSTVYSGDQKKTSKLSVTGLCEGIHQRPVNSLHKGPVTRKMFPFDDVIMSTSPESYFPHRTDKLTLTVSQYFCTYITGLILGLRPDNERRCNVCNNVSHWTGCKLRISPVSYAPFTTLITSAGTSQTWPFCCWKRNIPGNVITWLFIPGPLHRQTISNHDNDDTE